MARMKRSPQEKLKQIAYEWKKEAAEKRALARATAASALVVYKLPQRQNNMSRKRVVANEDPVSMEAPPWFELITKRNQRKSRLLKLPAEIRNKIFKFALAMPGQIHLEWWEMYGEESQYQIYPAENIWRDHAFFLPQVCRQIYAETAMKTYELNRFNVDCDYNDTVKFVKSRIPAQREELRSHVYIADTSGRTFQYMASGND